MRCRVPVRSRPTATLPVPALTTMPGPSSKAAASAISMSVVTTTIGARLSPWSAFSSSVALGFPPGACGAHVQHVTPQPSRAGQRLTHHFGDQRRRRKRPAGPDRGAAAFGARDHRFAVRHADGGLAAADIGPDQDPCHSSFTREEGRVARSGR